MALLAIIHLPDHTADDVPNLADITLTDGALRIVGLYEFPSHRGDIKCIGNCVRGKTGAWTRDPRGFMKCAICGSRNKRIRRWFTEALFDWFGANLLGDKAPALFRTPDGYGSSPSRHND